MVETVVIPATNNGPTLEEQAASQEAAALEASKASEVNLAGEDGNETEERPEWLPEKFKSVEEMAKAYSELEKGQSKPEEKPTDTPEDDEANKAVDEAGLDMADLSTEWADNEGKLSDESYEKLKAVGITPDMVDLYAKGIEAQAADTQAELLEPLGGNLDTYNELIGWATDELSEPEIDAFNAVLETGNTPAIKLAVSDLQAKYQSANGVEPSVELQGKGNAGGSSVYESTADLMKDMQNPEYAKNPAFRAKVETKLGRSKIL